MEGRVEAGRGGGGWDEGKWEATDICSPVTARASRPGQHLPEFRNPAMASWAAGERPWRQNPRPRAPPAEPRRERGLGPWRQGPPGNRRGRSRSPPAVAAVAGVEAPSSKEDYKSVLRDFFLRNRLSARETFRLASSSTHSGARGVEQFARAGAGGKFPGNLARDIMRAVRKGVKWPSPYWVSVPIKDKDCTMSLESVPVLLPHETFNFILEHTPDERHPSFLASRDSFLRPLVAEWAAEMEVDPDLVCPLGLHGDGVPFAAKMRDTLEQLSWNFCTNHSGSRILFAGLPKSCVGEGTVDDLLRVWSWSMRCLALGESPKSRHDGSEWKRPADSTRAGLGGHRMKYRVALLQLRADWDWLKKIYNFPSWATTGICWRCGAERRQGDLCFKDTGPDARWRAQRYSGEQFLRMQRARGMASPLWGCPGLKVEHVVIDWMHCVDLGVGQDCLGQCLWDLLPELAPGRAPSRR